MFLPKHDQSKFCFCGGSVACICAHVYTVPIITFHCGEVSFTGSLGKVKSIIEQNEENERVALETFLFAHHIFINFFSGRHLFMYKYESICVHLFHSTDVFVFESLAACFLAAAFCQGSMCKVLSICSQSERDRVHVQSVNYIEHLDKKNLFKQ